MAQYPVGDALHVAGVSGSAQRRRHRRRVRQYPLPRIELPRTGRWKQKHRQVARFLAQAKVDFFRTTHSGAQRLQTLLPQSYTVRSRRPGFRVF